MEKLKNVVKNLPSITVAGLLALAISSCEKNSDFEINCADIGEVYKEKTVRRSSGKNRYETRYYITVNGEKFEIEDGAAIYLLNNQQISVGTVIFSATGKVQSVELSTLCQN